MGEKRYSDASVGKLDCETLPKLTKRSSSGLCSDGNSNGSSGSAEDNALPDESSDLAEDEALPDESSSDSNSDKALLVGISAGNGTLPNVSPSGSSQEEPPSNKSMSEGVSEPSASGSPR